MTQRVLLVGGRAGNQPGGGASSVQLQVHHLLLRPAAAAALLQRCREDGQTAPHLGAHVHVRAESSSPAQSSSHCLLQCFTQCSLPDCRIMYRELKDSDKEKESGKMVGHHFRDCFVGK